MVQYFIEHGVARCVLWDRYNRTDHGEGMTTTSGFQPNATHKYAVGTLTLCHMLPCDVSDKQFS